MEIFNFEDLNVYHDKDWNEMQRSIYRSMKDKDVELSSKVDLLDSPYEYMIYDSLIDMTGISESTNIVYDDNKLVVTDDIVDSSFTSINYSIEILTEKVYLDLKLNKGNINDISCYISLDDGLEWVNIYPGQETILPSKSKDFKLRFEIPAFSDIEISHYVLFANEV